MRMEPLRVVKDSVTQQHWSLTQASEFSTPAYFLMGAFRKTKPLRILATRQASDESLAGTKSFRGHHCVCEFKKVSVLGSVSIFSSSHSSVAQAGSETVGLSRLVVAALVASCSSPGTPVECEMGAFPLVLTCQVSFLFLSF